MTKSIVIIILLMLTLRRFNKNIFSWAHNYEKTCLRGFQLGRTQPVCLATETTLKIEILLLASLDMTLGSTVVQWWSARLETEGGGFEPHRCDCVMVLEQDTFILA